jgi:hypothetical protein
MYRHQNNKSLLVAIGLIGMLIWIAFFAAGLLIDSKPYRDALIDGDISGRNLLLAALLYTPTNVALLSMLAGLLGGCASLMHDYGDLQEQIGKAQDEGKTYQVKKLKTRISYLSESPFSSMLRGFLVYLAIISGILLAISDPFGETSPNQYIRLAGLFSVIAFVMGFDPTRFEDLIETLSSFSQKGTGEK